MIRLAPSFLLCLFPLFVFPVTTLGQQVDLPADSKPQADVPQGEVKGPFEWKSKIFPGTVRNFWVYLPKQYDKDKPACLMVVQDGLRRAQAWRLPTVMDNLIHQGEIPVMVGIFIEPGVVPATNEFDQPRYNRSFEYDSMGDRYARFLIEEIIPEVGETYNISDDPNDRCIGGASSGAICAFTAAWERPDAFRRVLSTIGTYVGLRGGHEYPTLIRKMEPKPIRVFLQDGNRDLNIYGGDWWIANQAMLSALTFAGYDVKHAWGDGGHDNRAVVNIPEAMRWLWRDYPEPLKASIGKGAQRRTDLLLPNEPWELVSQGHESPDDLAVNAAGEVFFADILQSKIHKIDNDGNVTEFATATNAACLAFGPNGKLQVVEDGILFEYDKDGFGEKIVTDVGASGLLVLPDGSRYSLDQYDQRILHITPKGKPRVVAHDTEEEFSLYHADCLAMTPGQNFLYVGQLGERFVTSYQIQSDGSLAHRQPYGHLHRSDRNSGAGAGGMVVDTQGRLYVTTDVGIQVLDQPGRVHFIIAGPERIWCSDCVFGGPKFDTLYVTCGGKVYKRKLKATGVAAWQKPKKAPKPRL